MIPSLAFISDQAPDSKLLAVYAVLPLVIGVLVYLFLSRRDKGDIGYKLRLLALVPLVFGIYIGGVLTMKMATDFAYQQYNLIGTSRAILHYIVLVANLAGAIGIIIWNMAASKGPKYDF